MELINISCFIYVFSVVTCYSDSESTETNRDDISPFYDTIIYSDIADILNEFENNGMPAFELFTDSESQSDEKVESLLTEYQHYLEKAHKQRKNYAEKLKPKNKVPLLRHDQYTKMKPGYDYKQNDFYYNSIYRPNGFDTEHTAFNNPLNVFIPINSKRKYVNKLELTTVHPRGSQVELFPFKKILFNDKKIFDLSPVIHKSPVQTINSECYCKNGYMPCECNCKQCIMPNEHLSRDQSGKIRPPEGQIKSNSQYSSIYDNPLRKYDHNINDNIKDLSENTLNIHIKVDLQLPKLQENFGKYNTYSRTFEPEDVISKELSTAIKLPFTYFNFPTPMKIFETKKTRKHNKDDTTSLHKITVHKKRKSRLNNNNMKHKHPKIITIHNIKLNSQPLYPMQLLDNVTSIYDNKSHSTNSTTEQLSTIVQEITTVANKTSVIMNDTPTEENVYLMLNISNVTYTNTEKGQREDSHRFENSIEIDFTKVASNFTTTKSPLIRQKREVIDVNKGGIIKINETLPNHSDLYIKTKNITMSEKNFVKRPDKNLLTDAELLYWPIITRTQTNFFSKKNITTIILESEHKKTKLNMSKDSIRQNHTKALERAIFGDVNWDDIDTVAPIFMSFVGKYVHGILTFCSEKVCHSMNCADKICLHRICQPIDRLNNKGHCAGSSNTDSVASMESIMDLPSNIALEIVDILQDKLLGKVFGKATFCINSKCITLMASKKIFIKTRCTVKDLNITGHCSINKTLKVM